MRPVKLLLINCLVLVFIGCEQSSKSFEGKVLEKIETCFKMDDCRVSIKDVTSFEWDILHVFKYNATLDDVKKAIGSEPKQYTEFTRKVIFTLNGTVVYFEELPTDVSGLIENEIIFDIPDNKTYKSYSINESEFKVYREEIKEDEYFFELRQLN